TPCRTTSSGCWQSSSSWATSTRRWRVSRHIRWRREAIAGATNFEMHALEAAEKGRYHDHVIDLLRGVAALTVLVSHSDQAALLNFQHLVRALRPRTARLGVPAQYHA